MSENGAASRPALRALVVEHQAWREALGQVRAALSGSCAVVAVLGPAGTGKTLLLRSLLSELRGGGRDAMLLERGDSEEHPAARPGVVLVDEADRIDPAMLEALAESEALADSGVDGVVLAALPSFTGRMGAMLGATIVALRPLESEEAVAFVQARAEAMDAPERLTPEASTEIVANSRGIPRLLDTLLTAAEFVASLQAAQHVTAAHVREAVSLRGEMDLEALHLLPDVLPSERGEGGGLRSPAPDERWAESAGAIATTPLPARRRTGMRATLACAALVALFAAYAMVQPPGEGLGWWEAMPHPSRLGAAPATTPTPPAPPSTTPAADLASGQVVDEIPAVKADSEQVLGPAASGLPNGIVPHVVLSYRQGDADAERRGVEAARTLRSAGFAASDPIPMLGRIADPGIAYFFTEDQVSAADIGRALGGSFGEGRATALRSNEPLPRPGTIEVQLSSGQPDAKPAE